MHIRNGNWRPYTTYKRIEHQIVVTGKCCTVIIVIIIDIFYCYCAFGFVWLCWCVLWEKSKWLLCIRFKHWFKSKCINVMENQFWLFVSYFVGCQLRTVALSKCIKLEINITLILTNNNEFQRFCKCITICEHLSPFDEVKSISMIHLIIRSFATNTNPVCMYGINSNAYNRKRT